MFIDVSPAHVERFAASGAQEQKQLDGAGDDEARDLLAVLQHRIALAGGQRVHRLPELLDFFVGQDPLPWTFRAEALKAGSGIAFDQLLAEAPAERSADQGQDAVGSDRSLSGDGL